MNQTIKLETASRIVLKDSALSQCTWKSRKPRNHHRRTYRYLGCITWTIADGWIGDDEDDANLIAYRRGSIVVRLPFTSTQINAHYNVGMGTPSFALNVVHVIEAQSELGMRLSGLMQPGSDLRRLYGMFSERELSMYSIIRLRNLEMNLFFVSTRSSSL